MKDMSRKLSLVTRNAKGLLRYPDPPPGLTHLSYSLLQALRYLTVNHELNGRFQKGLLGKELLVIAAIPKSASTMIGPCANIILSDFIGNPDTKYLTLESDIDLQYDFGRHALWGGVFKSHIAANSTNLNVLKLIKSKYIILTRNPADQITAAYCQSLRSIEEDSSDNLFADNGFMSRPYYPMHSSYFGPGVNAEASLNRIISEGYLSSTLKWMMDWLRLRDHQQSLLLRYEDFMSDKESIFNGISRFISGMDIKDDTLRSCVSLANTYANRSHVGNSSYYPFGWSGQVGVWQKYFSEDNKNTYREVISEFLRVTPDAQMLLEVYPDLAINL